MIGMKLIAPCYTCEYIFKVAILPIILLSYLQSNAQVSIHGCIKDLPSRYVYLAEVNAGRTKLIDSAIVDRGCFNLYESDTIPVGVYFVILNPEKTAYIQLILNKENVAFHSSLNNIADSLVIDRSSDNILLYDFIRKDKVLSAEIAASRTASSASTSLAASTGNVKTSLLIKKREKFINDLISRSPNSLLSGILRTQIEVIYPAGLSEPNKNKYLHAHLFDHIDFNNSFLIRSSVLSDLMQNYLKYYENPALSIPDQSEQYAIAVDSLLLKTSNYSAAHNFFIKELSDKFRYGEYDVVTAYINEFYINHDLCSGSAIETNITSRIAALKHTSVGKQAPEILMPSFDGTTLRMSEIKNEYLLIVFWSSYCFHCTQVLPKLKQIYDHRVGNRFEVLAISTDTYQKDWQNFLLKENLTWINYCDLKGWDSEIAKSYNVQGTPTYLLLNNQKTIIAKPATLEELVQKLQDLKLFN